MRPIILCGDIQKAFWQIREPRRNSLRVHWIKNLHPNIVEIHRFTKLVFRLTQSTICITRYVEALFSELH